MSRSPPFHWNDAHFCGLSAQANVYSLSKIICNNDEVKLLAASIDGFLATVNFEYQSSSDKQVPVASNNPLFDSVLNANNPEAEGEMEIVSMDVVSDGKSKSAGTNILAVTYLKLGHLEEDKAPEAFMNVYNLSDFGDDKTQLSKSLIQQVSLDFVPFKLTHHRIPGEAGDWQTALLLSGSDHKIHVYMSNGNSEEFQEVDALKHFPEFGSLDDCVTQIEIRQLDDGYRLSCFGTQNGHLLVFLVNVYSKDILDSWTSDMDSPITSLRFFYQYTKVRCPDSLKNLDADVQSTEGEEESEEDALNLLVTSAVDPAIVYQDVVTNGLSKCRLLPVSNSQDVVLSSCVMDVDFDGENEILIGTYGKVMLVYKLMYDKPQTVYSSTPFHSPMPVPIHSDTPILPGDTDSHKSGKLDGGDCQDLRRRHRSMATTGTPEYDSSLMDRQDKHLRSDDSVLLSDGTLSHSHQALMLRLVRSQENLASPTAGGKLTHLDTPDRSMAMTPDLTIPHFAMTPGMEYPCYKLLCTRRFCNPVMGLMFVDVTGDGLLDLVVLTLKGLHVLQPDLQEVSNIVLHRLQQMCAMDKSTHPDASSTQSCINESNNNNGY